MKVTYSEEAVADIVDAIAYLIERSPTAAANLDAEISLCVERLAEGEFDGPLSRLRSGAVVRSWAMRPFRIYYQRHLGRAVDHPRVPSGAAPDRAVSASSSEVAFTLHGCERHTERNRRSPQKTERSRSSKPG